MNATLCDQCDLPATREISYVANHGFADEQGGSIAVCHNQFCWDEVHNYIEDEFGADAHQETIDYVIPGPREIPEPERTAQNSPAWFGLHVANPNRAARVETTEAQKWEKGVGMVTTTHTHLHWDCEDCGQEFRTSPGGMNPKCPVNQETYQARMAEMRRRLLAA